MAKRALELAKLIFNREPDALTGDPDAVDRITQMLAKIIGVFLARKLDREGEEALAEAAQEIAKLVEREARETATTLRLLDDDTGDPPSDAIN